MSAFYNCAHGMPVYIWRREKQQLLELVKSSHLPFYTHHGYFRIATIQYTDVLNVRLPIVIN
jgi:ABC-type long-subunit fatty acid transport system fused permease/ATPase subunit